MKHNPGENSLALVGLWTLTTPSISRLIAAVQAAAANDLTEAKAVLLPRFVVLRNSDKKYLSVTQEDNYKMHVRCEKTAQDTNCTFSIDSNVGQGQN